VTDRRSVPSAARGAVARCRWPRQREVVGAGGDLEGRLHVGIGIERPLGYLHNRFRN